MVKPVRKIVGEIEFQDKATKAIAKLNRQMDKSQKGMKRMQTAAQKVKKAQDKTIESTLKMVTAFKSLAVVGIGIAVVRGLTNIAKTTLMVATNFEQIDVEIGRAHV